MAIVVCLSNHKAMMHQVGKVRHKPPKLSVCFLQIDCLILLALNAIRHVCNDTEVLEILRQRCKFEPDFFEWPMVQRQIRVC
jgi:hypothetical protein